MSISFTTSRISKENPGLSDFSCLSHLRSLIDEDQLQLFSDGQTAFDRKAWDGIFTFTANVGGRETGFIVCDFRVNGGSFAIENSARVKSFIEEMINRHIPVVFWLNSMGVRLMAGRQTYRWAFAVLPALMQLSRRLPLITAVSGQCLGLAAALYGWGQYRLAVSGPTHLCLTGPDVIRLFFGGNDSSWDTSSAEKLQQSSGYVQEICQSSEVMARRIRELLTLQKETLQKEHLKEDHHSLSNENFYFGCPSAYDFSELSLTPEPEKKLSEFLAHLGRSEIELFPQGCRTVRTHIMSRNGSRFGLLVNPLGEPDNSISSDTLKKYCDSFDFFAAHKLPVVSAIDAPGIDPRAQGRDILQMFNETARRIIDYPYGKFGIVAGRGYGGSTTLGLPRIFGADKTIALTTAKMGFMDASIVRALFQNSPRLLQEWELSLENESADLQDLVETGNIDSVVALEDLGSHVDEFLKIARTRIGPFS